MSQTRVLFLAFLALFLLPCLSYAGYGKGNQVISASFGGVLGADDFNEVKGVGVGGGVGYRYYLIDFFSLGVDLSADHYGDHYSEEDETDVDVSLYSSSLVGRIDFWPRNPWASYFALGLGGHYLDRTFHDAGGDRTETTGRSGYFMALGFEAPFQNDRWMWGMELRSMDPIGISANALGLKFTLSRRFGKNLVVVDQGIE